MKLGTKNIKEVQNGLYDKEKIETHAIKMGMHAEDLEEEIKKGNVPAAYVISKDPTRQNIQEPFQANYINSAVGYEAVKLITNKNNKITFKENGYSTKTTDAFIYIKDKEYYAGMKLITNSGGAQDNQRKELQLYLSIGANVADKPVIALIDDTHPKPTEFYMNPVKDRNRGFVFSSDSLIAHIRYYQ